MQGGNDVFNDFLDALGVKHTQEYSRQRFDTMSFKSLFGFTKLLAEYGIDSEGVDIADKDELTALTPPFLARLDGAYVIVLDLGPDRVTYRSEGDVFTVDSTTFKKSWTGNVLLAYPRPDAVEPDYRHHHFLAVAERVKTWLFCLTALLLTSYAYTTAQLYRSAGLSILLLIDFVGIFVSTLLILKSLNIHSGAADRMCGVIEKEGCNTVLSTDASKFFGLFGWSEVGMAYFSISTLCLLLFPQYTNYLALLNVCCLPFSFWSVWYQKYRAKAWCTLCLTVQASLWLSFFCYLGAGAFHDIFPLKIQLFVLGFSYFGALLLINKLVRFFELHRKI